MPPQRSTAAPLPHQTTRTNHRRAWRAGALLRSLGLPLARIAAKGIQAILPGGGSPSSFHSRRTRRILRSEPLETRFALDAGLRITEVVAANDQGLKDEDGDSSDWIELYNDSDEAVQLSDWHLTDNLSNPTKWTFPSLSLPPRAYQIVFASGKDRRASMDRLHTNFSLRAAGEDLALITPDGHVQDFNYAPYPELETDRSFGLRQGLVSTTVVGDGAAVSILVPSEQNGGFNLPSQLWTAPELDVTTWRQGVSGVGYELQTGFESLIRADVASEMLNKNASVYLRYPFELRDAQSVFSLILRMKYDDGYVAYLNGTEIARRNAPLELKGDATATASHVDSQAVVFEDVDLVESLSLLRDGANILAIHGLNSASNSNDFLIVPELIVGTPGPLVADSPQYFAEPTPSAPNGLLGYATLVKTVTANPPRGIYHGPLQVQLRSPTPGALLVYTLDGSTPTPEHGNRVAPPTNDAAATVTLDVTHTTVVRVAAFRDAGAPARLATYSYVISDTVVAQTRDSTLAAGFPEKWGAFNADYGLDSDVVGPNDRYQGVYRAQFEAGLTSLPSMSLVMNTLDMFGPQGIYSNPTQTGQAWERPTSVELISADGQINHQVNAGIRIAGNSARDLNATRKKSFRLEFRRDYGAASLQYPLFGDGGATRFDSIILRNIYNDGWQWDGAGPNAQYLRDEWMRATQMALSGQAARGTFMNLFINGQYWGLYNVTERPDAEFASRYLGGEPDEWDTLNTGTIVDGNEDAWKALMDAAALVNTTDTAASQAAYQRLLGRRPDGTRDPALEPLLDVDQYIDYMIVNFYAGNTDWPGRNWYAARRRGADSTGFQFFAWDNEWILNLKSSLTTDRTDVDESVAFVYSQLRSQPQFRQRFSDRVEHAFAPGGPLYVDPTQPTWNPDHPERNRPAALYVALAERIEQALVAESARWGDQHVQPSYTVADWHAERDRLLTNYFPQRSAIVLLQLERAGLWRGGIPGGSSVADFNHDQRVDLLDLDALCAAVLDRTDALDLNGDHRSTRADVDLMVTRELHSTYGDANLDGRFTSSDLVLVLQYSQYEDDHMRNSTWITGDWNCDGEFDTADLVWAFQSSVYES